MNNELKQIVIETNGVWPEGVNTIYKGYRGEISTSMFGSAIGYNCYTRQQYEQCLRELTGRPPSKEWHGGYDWFAVDENGECFLYKNRPVAGESSGVWGAMDCCYNAGYSDANRLDWKNTLISREESVKRDAIIDGDDQLKICNESCRELGSGCVCDVVLGGQIHNKDADDEIQDKAARKVLEAKDDWFRNGEAPPVGKDVLWCGSIMKVIGIHDGLVWLECKRTKKHWTEKSSSVEPEDFNLNVVHAESLVMNNSMRADDIIKRYGCKDWPDITKSTAANMIIKMIKDGIL